MLPFLDGMLVFCRLLPLATMDRATVLVGVLAKNATNDIGLFTNPGLLNICCPMCQQFGHTASTHACLAPYNHVNNVNMYMCTQSSYGCLFTEHVLGMSCSVQVLNDCTCCSLTPLYVCAVSLDKICSWNCLLTVCQATRKLTE